MKTLLRSALAVLLACLMSPEVWAQSTDYGEGTYFPPPPWLSPNPGARPGVNAPANPDMGTDLQGQQGQQGQQGGAGNQQAPSPSSSMQPRPSEKVPAEKNYREENNPNEINREGFAQPVIRPFGMNLFQGQFVAQQEAGLNPNYVVAPGDRVLVNLWGAQQFSGQLTVDAQGNIFIPDVGPVQVGGILSKDLNKVVGSKVSSVYSHNVMVYTNLATTQPVGVIVSGFVARPGRYAGVPSASLLYFIDRAGGILEEQGSFRDIRVLRNGRLIATADLYEFLLEGQLPILQFQEGDTILVGRRNYAVEVTGDVQNPAIFEFKQEETTGGELMRLAGLNVGVTNVAQSGIRDGVPFRNYLSRTEFDRAIVRNGDRMRFTSDARAQRIFVNVEGQSRGPSVLAVRIGAKLSDVLNLIEVDPNTANTSAVFVRRRSVAEAQKKAIEDTLYRLQKSALLATAASDGVAAIRQAEAKMVTDFVDRAAKVRPEGRVVLATNDGPSDIMLEQDDQIVIPRKTDVVQVSGEVVLPHDVAYQPEAGVSRYINMSGGFSDRADHGHILLIRQSGEVLDASSTKIMPGDFIMVLPEVDVKYFQLGKELTQVLYQIAVSAAVVLNL